MNVAQGYLQRNCPVCGSQPPQDASARSATKAEDVDFQSLIPYWNGFFKEKVYFSYARCTSCELLFSPVFFNATQLGQLYGQMPPNMAEVPLAALRRTQVGYFRMLAQNSPLTGGMIEIGPDIGLFTECCAKEGAFREFWLFEPNRDVKDQLSRAVGNKTHHIIHDMFGFDNVPDGAASVAVMVHVLDHLLDPVATLRELRRKLAPGATLLLVTHDESSLLRRLVGWRWPAFCLQHPQIYNRATMRRLLAEAGYRVVKQRKTTNYFQVGFLLRHLLWAFGFKAFSISALDRLTVGLKLGNILTLATPENGDQL